MGVSPTWSRRQSGTLIASVANVRHGNLRLAQSQDICGPDAAVSGPRALSGYPAFMAAALCIAAAVSDSTARHAWMLAKYEES